MEKVTYKYFKKTLIRPAEIHSSIGDKYTIMNIQGKSMFILCTQSRDPQKVGCVSELKKA